MSDWLNPQHWTRQLPDPLGVRDILHEGATAWINEVASAAVDRPIEVCAANHSVTGTIQSVRLEPAVAPGPTGRSDFGADALESAAV